MNAGSLIADGFREATSTYIKSAEQRLSLLLQELEKLEIIKREVENLQVSIKAAKIAGRLQSDVANKAIVPEETTPHIVDSHQEHILGNGVKLKVDLATMPLKEKAKAIILEAGRPMSPKEVAVAFYARGWKLSKSSGNEVIRGMFGNEKETFQRVQPGYYDVIK